MTFEEWYNEDDHDLFNFPEEAMKAAWEASRSPGCYGAWQPIEEMETDSYEGWCWIVHKGRVVEAYRDHRYRYLFGKFSQNCYMTESVTYVMKWPHPEAP